MVENNLMKQKGSRKSVNSLGLNQQNQFADWEIGTNYVCEKMLGTGSYGKVALATCVVTKQKVAIKRMENIFDDETDCKRILREIALMRRLKHPFLIGIVEILMPSDPANFDTLYVVMEFAESDLKKIIKSNINLELIHIQTIVYNLLCGIKYLHDSNVLHRDLKPANVLINEDCTVKLCDYGLARSISGIQSADVYLQKAKKGGNSNTDSSSEADDDTDPQKSSVSGGLSGSSIKLNIAGQSSSAGQMQSKNALDIQQPPQQAEKVEEEKKEDLRSRLVKTKEQRRNMKRELTGHVVTRWYRAPEIILLEKDYGPGIDIWAVGCIYAELLGMMKENAPTFMDRQALFPGKSCFPLSPAKNPTEQRQGFPFSGQDQLNVIFAVIGTPSDADKSFVTDQKALEYLEQFSPIGKVQWTTKYPAADETSVDFLNKILQFNPYFRMTIPEALDHPLFSKIRNKQRETVAAQQISLDFEAEGELKRDRLRELILQEAALSSKERADQLSKFTQAQQSGEPMQTD